MSRRFIILTNAVGILGTLAAGVCVVLGWGTLWAAAYLGLFVANGTFVTQSLARDLEDERRARRDPIYASKRELGRVAIEHHAEFMAALERSMKLNCGLGVYSDPRKPVVFIPLPHLPAGSVEFHAHLPGAVDGC